MNNTSLKINELDLITFFGSTHVSRVFGSEWFDSDSVYEAEKENTKVSFAIHPIHSDVRICLYENEKKTYDFQGQNLYKIELTNKDQELKLSMDPNDTIILKLEPYISIEHINKRNSDDI